jgi:hypothetical protein
MLDENELYVIETDGSIHLMNFVGDSDWDIEPTISLQEIRVKVIDEFAEEFNFNILADSNFMFDRVTLYKKIREIKEQMKGE